MNDLNTGGYIAPGLKTVIQPHNPNPTSQEIHLFITWRPAANVSTEGSMRYDRSRELRFVRPTPVGATPVANHPVEPLRGSGRHFGMDTHFYRVGGLDSRAILPLRAGLKNFKGLTRSDWV